MKFRTEVELPEYSFRIDHRTPVLMMGSCFTENAGQNLRKYLFDTCINPFGVIYNPLSVNKGLLALIEKEVYDERDLHFHNGLYQSFDHYTKFSDARAAVVLDRINDTFREARHFLLKARYLIITFGTAFVYRYRETGEVVCNCHKIPASNFTREMLDPDAIFKAYVALLGKLKEIHPNMRILFTVSPVRHWKDGAHGNQLSKSTLLLAIDRLCCHDSDHFSYFPSYELVMDDLRDYRFYAEDLLHPNDMAVEYIWERFSEALITAESRQIISELEPVLRAYRHKPMHPGSPEYEKFMIFREKSLKELMHKYPFLMWDEFQR